MLRRLKQRMASFGRDRSGAVAIIFGITIVPVMGLTGGAVDFNQASRDMARLQSAFDAAALAGVRQSALGDAGARLAAQNSLNANLSARLRAYPYTITTSNNGTNVRIATNGATMDTTFMALIGMRTLNIVAKSTAISSTYYTVTSAKPVIAQLDIEAGDYNRMYVYCFDNNRRNQADRGRSQMTAIADNAGTTYSFNMPVCKEKETMSYRLYNVRNARTKPWLWETALPGTLIKNNSADWADPWSNNASYNYYSDTENVSGVPTPRFENNVPILETVICDSLAQCKPTSQGGILPSGANRTPQQAQQACSPGKFMYFGWEDRPTGYGWTDSDYDDIRVVVECPKTSTTTTTTVRLIE